MRLEAVFFDLYGTLLIYGDMTSGWSAWLKTLQHWLHELGLEIDAAALAKKCEGFFSRPAPAEVADGLTVYEGRLDEFARGLGLEVTPNELRH